MIPGLTASPQKVGNALTMTGFMMDGLKEVNYQGNKDFIISLEIRQNRADCLSVIGLAREVAAYYGLSVKLPDMPALVFNDNKLNIEVDAKDYIKRILAIRIMNLKNKESPEWLKEFLALYEINSINFLVDLSNYVMLVTGYPSHLIDIAKIDSNIVWSVNKEFSKIVTLDGSVVELKKDKELIIRDSKNIIALAGIVGGEFAKIDINTKSIVVEMAVYDRSIIRRNSRSLRIVTEASHRLEKDLDPNGSEYAIGLF